MNTALEQLEHWIEQYKRINGTPPINEVLTQIDLLKDYEKEQCNIDLVSGCLSKEELHKELKEYAQWYQMDDLRRKEKEKFDSIIDRYIEERK